MLRLCWLCYARYLLLTDADMSLRLLLIFDVYDADAMPPRAAAAPLMAISRRDKYAPPRRHVDIFFFASLLDLLSCFDFSDFFFDAALMIADAAMLRDVLPPPESDACLMLPPPDASLFRHGAAMPVFKCHRHSVTKYGRFTLSYFRHADADFRHTPFRLPLSPAFSAMPLAAMITRYAFARCCFFAML